MAIIKITATTDLEYQKSLVEEIDSMIKFDEILKLCEFYHVKRCKNEDCSNCWFIVNLRYLHNQNNDCEMESVVPL